MFLLFLLLHEHDLYHTVENMHRYLSPVFPRLSPLLEAGYEIGGGQHSLVC